METNDRFKNSPLHDKKVILEMMDELQPIQMIDLVKWLQGHIKNLNIPVVIKSVCPQCKNEHTEVDCQGYCTAYCLQESEGQTVL